MIVRNLAVCIYVLLFALLSFSSAVFADIDRGEYLDDGDAQRGRLVFGPCRTCHYAQEFMGHNNGPNLHRIFGKVAGKQQEFSYYSEAFKKANVVWTPELLYLWLADPTAMFPGSNMMSLGVPDPQKRADLIAFLKVASQGPFEGFDETPSETTNEITSEVNNKTNNETLYKETD
ncbi:MAG: cytochrome c [Halioglobus sp.]